MSGLLNLLLTIFLALKAHFTAPAPPPPVVTPPIHIKPPCNPNLWKYIWYPARLKVLEDCKTVEGTIEKKFLSEDGDYHLLLAPDHLVLEIICAGPIEPKVKVAVQVCAGYENQIPVPQVGDRVSVTGSYVFDTTHNWNEIHPVSFLEKF